MIIRVFPKKTSYTPDDDMAFIGLPPMFELPEHKEVYVSCTFTWDVECCRFLQRQWQGRTDKPVKLGGVAFGSPNPDFVPGMYVKQGITFTSRGCNNNCPWCLVPKREGKLRLLPIQPGHIIQDNNFLQCPREHQEAVFEMLKSQKSIEFQGGLQADLITPWFAGRVRKLSIKSLWLACDTDGHINKLVKAAKMLHEAGFTQNHLRCYVLIGINGMKRDEARLRQVYDAGVMPFAQLFRDEADSVKYSAEYQQFQRTWARPAATKAHIQSIKIITPKYRYEQLGL